VTDYPKFAVFTIAQLKAAAKEIASKSTLSEEEIWKILCKWTKEIAE
jgi:hypothetical protein